MRRCPCQTQDVPAHSVPTSHMFQTIRTIRLSRKPQTTSRYGHLSQILRN